MEQARRLRTALTLALMLVVAGLWVYFHAASPGTVFRVFNADPEMAYFLDALAPFKGQAYRFSYHPGTPLSVLGSVLLALLFPFLGLSREAFVRHLIQHPEPFMVLAHGVLACANLGCIFALSRKALPVRRSSDALLAAAVPGSFFAFLPQAFFWPFYWSHNAVAFPAGTLMLLALLAGLRRGRPLPTPTTAALGLAAGALAATQLYFATWVLGLAVAATLSARPGRRGWWLRPAIVTLLASAAGFLICTLPILSAHARFLAFARGVLLHQDLYGTGPAGFTSAGRWTANLAALWGASPLLFLVTGLVFAMLLVLFVAGRARWRRDSGRWAMAAGLSLQWLATLVLLAKHPSPFYLPALAAMLPLLLALVFTLGRRSAGPGRLACLVLAAAVLLGCGRMAVSAVVDHARRIAFRAAMEQDVEHYLAGYAAARGTFGRGSSLLLWGPGLPDAGCYALWMANLYIDAIFQREISEACPSEGLAWSNRVAVPDGWSSRETVAAVLVTPEDAPERFPAFAALGEQELLPARDPQGRRLAFYRVSVQDGRLRRASP